MKPAAPSLRDRLRAQLADLKMPSALEALDDVLRQLDGGSLSPSGAIEALLGAQISCLGTRRIAELRALQRETGAWNTRANRTTIRIRWQFTRRDARKKFGYQKNLSNRSKT